MQALYEDFVMWRLPIPEWDLLPAPCPGLGLALPVATAAGAAGCSRLLQGMQAHP